MSAEPVNGSLPSLPSSTPQPPPGPPFTSPGPTCLPRVLLASPRSPSPLRAPRLLWVPLTSPGSPSPPGSPYLPWSPSPPLGPPAPPTVPSPPRVPLASPGPPRLPRPPSPPPWVPLTPRGPLSPPQVPSLPESAISLTSRWYLILADPMPSLGCSLSARVQAPGGHRWPLHPHPRMHIPSSDGTNPFPLWGLPAPRPPHAFRGTPPTRRGHQVSAGVQEVVSQPLRLS